MALTINQTRQNDNTVVFLMKLYSEGNNLISNSAFGSSTGWTLTGDWTIAGGTLNYTYVDDATGNASFTVSAVTADEYVLEYEVTSLTGTAFQVDLVTGVGIISSQTITLDKSLGKHYIYFYGNSGGTIFRLTASLFSAGEAISFDNIKVRKRFSTIHCATRDITISSQAYDGASITWNALGNINGSLNAEGGGGIGSVASYDFKISRFNINTQLDGYFNEFQPGYDGGNIISRRVELGFVWDVGTPTSANITWIFSGKIISYGYENRIMNMIVFQETEVTSLEIPYYSIQNDFDNEVSYFTNAPEENYGLALPIVYGDFSIYDDDQELFKPRLFPIVCVEQYNLRYVCGSHKFDSELWSTGGGTASAMYQYVDGLDTYMTITCDNGSADNNDIIAYVTNYDTLNSTDNVLLGTINIIPTLSGSQNDVSNYSNVLDGSTSTYITITNGGVYRDTKLSLKIKGGGSSPGTISRAANSIIVIATINGESPLSIGNTGFITIYNPEYNSGVGEYGTDYSFGWTSGIETKQSDRSSEFSARDVSDEPWRWDELMGLEYIVVPSFAGGISYAIDVSSLWVKITNIIVNDPRLSRTRTKTVKELYGETRRRGGR